MLMPRRQLNCGMAVAIMAMAAQPAFADGPYHRGCDPRSERYWDHRSRAEVDIESLKARLHRTYDRWALHVRYEVEIEDDNPSERFDLVLRVTEHGRELRDQWGQTLRFAVPLDRPAVVHSDEIEFKRGLDLHLPDGSFRGPEHLRIWAKVVRRQDSRVFDRKDKSIKFEGCSGRRGVSVNHDRTVRESGRSQRVRSGYSSRITHRERSVQHRRTTSRSVVKKTIHRRNVRRVNHTSRPGLGVRITVRR